jgi:hypothetical protein
MIVNNEVVWIRKVSCEIWGSHGVEDADVVLWVVTSCGFVGRFRNTGQSASVIESQKVESGEQSACWWTSERVSDLLKVDYSQLVGELVNGNAVPVFDRHAMNTYRGEEVKLRAFLTLSVGGGEWSPSRPESTRSTIYHVLSESVTELEMDTWSFYKRVSRLTIKINQIIPEFEMVD